MLSRKRQENLIIVAAVDRYARTHGISSLQAYDIFNSYDLFNILRGNFEVLHTQGINEGARFANDYITRQEK
ncbi:MAG: DUF3791 domain-containing protein [Coriobacteriia bacterium]|nr:DUF3791 domain-containing protein [Coriobacteriia bacterium]